MSSSPPRLGLRENLGQFIMLVVVNAFVGGMVGLERTVLPLLAEDEFGIASRTAILSFIATFGLTKALANTVAGHLGDRYGRKRVLVAGWLVGLPVPLIVIAAPTWEWVVFANVLLGINQGLAWSMTIIMKVDLVGPKQRGLAMGLNEAAGYLAVSAAALATGYIAGAYALRPEPFYLGIGLAIIGLLASVFFVRDTSAHAKKEEADWEAVNEDDGRFEVSYAEAFRITSWRDRALFAVSQAGLINNMNDGLAWGLFPIYFATLGLPVEQIGLLTALYPAVWGLGQMGTGALSDRWGRKWMIAAGMAVQAVGLFTLIAGEAFGVLAGAMILMGAGTAMVYPTLLAAISDVAHPSWRGTSIGVYRLWRDGGYVVGALVAGITADALGMEGSIIIIGALTAASAVVVSTVMYETLSPDGRRQAREATE
ncbi:MFS transporter [Longibacter salinarum]|uniref:MFS transporter n=1 Tax=Longibacter salinarum TaxID=1850348 RepID=A0A2A8CUM9_9BACT|nr:MFS transporter [Longibacter salinarum]PEN11457.1 MFS transporter [Longibacter salinarum]